MATLSAAMTATTKQLPADVEPGFYELDSERIRVGPERWQTLDPVTHAETAVGRYCERGIAGTTAAAHASGTTLTQYYPDGASGAGGVTSVNGLTGVVVLRAAYIDPTTATPEAHVQATIDGDLMDGPP